MQSTTWTEEHSEALRRLLDSGMSFSRAADTINEKFNTAYSRCAAIGRAKRMGLAGPDISQDRPESLPIANAPPQKKSRESYAAEFLRRMPVFDTVEPTILRCVEIEPRHLSLLDLEPGDCRYPYGGDTEGEAITFCGHPRRRGASYCVAHFHLTRVSGAVPERAAGTVLLTLVEAA
jgi:GcrA cell cycle regulator